MIAVILLLLHAPLLLRGVCLFGKARLECRDQDRYENAAATFCETDGYQSVAPARVAIVQAHRRPCQVKPPGLFPPRLAGLLEGPD